MVPVLVASAAAAAGQPIPQRSAAQPMMPARPNKRTRYRLDCSTTTHWSPRSQSTSTQHTRGDSQMSNQAMPWRHFAACGRHALRRRTSGALMSRAARLVQAQSRYSLVRSGHLQASSLSLAHLQKQKLRLGGHLSNRLHTRLLVSLSHPRTAHPLARGAHQASN